jgi:hypothetical protein
VNDADRTGADLLDELRQAITYYTVFPTAEAADAVVLWIATTYAVSVFDAAPRLHFTGPEKRCGKSRALDMAAATSNNPLVTTDATTAAVFRSIGDNPPTLVFDEVDAIFPGPGKKTSDQHEDLRSLLNAGFQRGRPAIRCVGPNNEVKRFPTFAMAALAGIGQLPDTITDRSVVIQMRRRAPNEKAAPFRLTRDQPALRALGDQVGAWVRANLEKMRAHDPALPVEDRAADLWEPLITVADVAGGTWPERARTAALVLTRQRDEDNGTASLGVKLLADCREIFASGVAEASSVDLVAALHGLPDAPWQGFNLTQAGLAAKLRPYGITPRQVRPGGGGREEKQVRGYRASDFTDAFTRYLPQAVTPSHEQASDSEAEIGVTDQGVTPR